MSDLIKSIFRGLWLIFNEYLATYHLDMTDLGYLATGFDVGKELPFWEDSPSEIKWKLIFILRALNYRSLLHKARRRGLAL